MRTGFFPAMGQNRLTVTVKVIIVILLYYLSSEKSYSDNIIIYQPLEVTTHTIEPRKSYSMFAPSTEFGVRELI